VGLALSVFFGFAPMLLFASWIYWLDRYEKEPRLLLGTVFTWGALIAAGGAYLVNTFLGLNLYTLTQSRGLTLFASGSVIAPIVEETLKGLAVLLVFYFFRSEFDSLLDGVVYAAVAALGFAATENSYYIYQYGYKAMGYAGLFSMVFVRVLLVGWQHPFYTAFYGVGLALARLNRPRAIRILAPLLGWAAAVLTHSLHNALVRALSPLSSYTFGTLLDWSGVVILFLFILWVTNLERLLIVEHLKEEVALGVISAAQYRTASWSWAQSAAGLLALSEGKYAVTRRFYQQCAELAHKKSHYARLGDEGGNLQAIRRLRAELARLAPQAVTT